MIKAYIDPSSQVYYASFYIQGLYDSIGKPNISFSAKYFKDLRRNEGRTAYDVYFAFVLINDGVITKYVMYLQPIITQYFIDNKSEIWLLFLIAHSKR